MNPRRTQTTSLRTVSVGGGRVRPLSPATIRDVRNTLVQKQLVGSACRFRLLFGFPVPADRTEFPGDQAGDADTGFWGPVGSESKLCGAAPGIGSAQGDESCDASFIIRWQITISTFTERGGSRDGGHCRLTHAKTIDTVIPGPGITRRVGQRWRSRSPRGGKMTDNRRGGTQWETKAARRTRTRVRNR